MNNKESTKCICTNQGYAPDCPQAFMQNGTLMHTLEGENQLKPRYYGDAQVKTNSQEKKIESVDPLDYLVEDHPAHSENAVNSMISVLQEEKMKVRSFKDESSGSYRAETIDERSWATDTDMQQKERGYIPTFNPLQYNGKTMTEATIGGYRIDMGVAQKKLTEYIPLPPVFLPVIFVDKDLNFSHHFFQGMEVLMGKDKIDKIVCQDKHSINDSVDLLPTVKQFIMAGAKAEDNELTLFVKRVLTGTFDTIPGALLEPGKDELIVSLNMWGFQYIEPGMRCKDNDLRMWLHMSHLKYRVSWFNAFKSAGIPKFAMSGVQDRYESRSAVTVEPMPKKYHHVENYEYPDVVQSEGRRRRSHRENVPKPSIERKSSYKFF